MKWSDIARVKPDYDRCLVFSDWLEDQNDPLALRRAQVLRQLVRLERWPITYKFKECSCKVAWFAFTGSYDYYGRGNSPHWMPPSMAGTEGHHWWVKTGARISGWMIGAKLNFTPNPITECLRWACSELDPDALAKLPEQQDEEGY